MSLYKVLGVRKNAAQASIKTAYKKKAGKLHPDKNPNDPNATANFQELQKAYEILSDPERRKHYDTTGEIKNRQPALEQKAYQLIKELYLKHIEQSGYRRADYLQPTTKSLQNTLRQCKSAIAQAGNQRDLLKYNIENIEADEMFIDSLNDKLTELQNEIENAKQAETVLEAALELIDGYSYKGEKPIPSTGNYAPWHINEPFIE